MNGGGLGADTQPPSKNRIAAVTPGGPNLLGMPDAKRTAYSKDPVRTPHRWCPKLAKCLQSEGNYDEYYV